MLIQTQKVRRSNTVQSPVKAERQTAVQPAMLAAKLQVQVKTPISPRI